jgi:hypothetical protein
MHLKPRCVFPDCLKKPDQVQVISRLHFATLDYNLVTTIQSITIFSKAKGYKIARFNQLLST